ncbi:MAG TPA: PadR family transcriptional regulator [Nevskia sp.]|nr:PadR family transcriptional regulator [Nevskia sp.]
MSLRHAILVLLEQKPGSGYDLAQRFKGGIGHFWSASHQQIYLELKKLDSRKLVEFEVQPQSERPDKKNYRITTAGRSALKAWLLEPTRPERLNSALLVKIYAANLAEPAALVAELEQNLAEHRRRLDEYTSLEQSYLEKGDKLSRKQSQIYLTLRSGIRYEWNWIEMLNEARALLSDNQVPSRPVLETLARRTAPARRKPA